MRITFEGVYVGRIGALTKLADCHKCGERTPLMYGLFTEVADVPRLPTCTNCCHNDFYFGGLLDGAVASVHMTPAEIEMYRKQEQRTEADASYSARTDVSTGGSVQDAGQTG